MSKVTEIVDDLRNIEGVTSNLQEQINARKNKRSEARDFIRSNEVI